MTSSTDTTGVTDSSLSARLSGVEDEAATETGFRRFPDFSSLRRIFAMYSFENFLILAVFSSDSASSLPSL